MKVKKLMAAVVPVTLLLSGCVTVKDSASKDVQLIRKKKVKMFKRFEF